MSNYSEGLFLAQDWQPLRRGALSQVQVAIYARLGVLDSAGHLEMDLICSPGSVEAEGAGAGTAVGDWPSSVAVQLAPVQLCTSSDIVLISNHVMAGPVRVLNFGHSSGRTALPHHDLINPGSPAGALLGQCHACCFRGHQ